MAIALVGGLDGNQTAAGASQISSSSSSSTTTTTTAASITTPTTTSTAIPDAIAGTTDSKKDVPPSNNSGVDMLGGCSVCSDDQGSEENPLVYCDGCDLSVHQACYGIVRVPPGNWFCKKCECRDTQKEIKCELCPAQDGALKKTETGQWAHVVCALYIPEVRFGNNNTMEPIIIKHIQPDRYSKNCYLCEENNNSVDATYGAVMDCHKPSCKQSFHVTCAQSEGLLCEEAGQGSDNLIYCGYCKHHFRKLKAGNRKTSNSLNNSGSSFLDSASDSSQDNDSRCNTKEHLDKSRANKLPTIQPTTLSINDVVATYNNSSSTSANATTTATNSSALSNNSRHDSTKNAPISLTLTLNSTFSNSNTPNATTTPIGPSQKKRRAPKSSPSGSNNNSTTLLAAPGAASNYHQPPTASSLAPTTNIAAQDVYNWAEKDPMINNNNINSNNNNTSNNTKSSKKKPASSTQPTPSSKLIPTATLSGSSLTNYNHLQKISSPNLSLSTSSSLTSPANSTKSTSNSSTTATASSSSSSTTSNSPSPSLLSPNNIPSRGSTIRQESPLASNSKTGNNSQGSRQESITSNNTLPFGQAGQQTRINYADPKIEPKKSSTSSTSLLSTAVPMSLDTDLASNSSTRNLIGQEILPTKQNSYQTSINQNSNLQFNTGFSGDHNKSVADSNTTNSSNINTQQPTVPPLIIPVPQLTQNLAVKHPTSKSKSGSKTSNSRKKSTEANETGKSETTPKPKPSRSKTKPPTNANTVVDGSSTAKAPEAKSKGKSKSPATKAPTAASTSADLEEDVTPKPAPAASKRKSRSASNTTDTSVAPSPAKRSRKKKSEAPVNSPEKPSGNVVPNQSSSVTNPPQNSVSTSNGFIATGPLMINTPIVNNRLMQGMTSLENQEMGNRYGFSPLISPYANFDHLNAPSLSRSSLSRLFTTSLADPGYQIGMPEDPMKAFDELRENTWSHLSKCVLDQAQQFDIPSLIGTLYTLRSENEKLFNKVRDLKMKRDELLAMNARLDLPGPLLTQHLNNTSPNFSSVVSGLTNSPKSLPTPSPGSGINKQPLVSVGPYNHLPPGSLGPPNYIDRSSPLVGQTHSGISNIKSSSISTPSPPIGALMAHSGSSNRAGLITVNSPYLSSSYPPPMNSMNSLGPSPQGSSYYHRQ